MGYIQTLVSSSSGNSIFYKSKNTALLIDAGVSCRKICTLLNEAGSGIDEVDALLITHEHLDHISGIKTLVNRKKKKVFANKKTAERIIEKFSDIDPKYIHIIESDKKFVLKDIEIMPFTTSHDSAHSLGYTFDDGLVKVGAATDLGVVTDVVKKNLNNCKKCVIEANHDENMLLNSDYPYHLKRRILSDKGHLSNDLSAKFIYELLKDGCNEFLLAHLSRQNNIPYLALETVRAYLSEKSVSEEISVNVAPYDNISTKICW